MLHAEVFEIEDADHFQRQVSRDFVAGEDHLPTQARADDFPEGEAGVGVIAPAIANAIFAASGTRLRSMPFRNLKLRAGTS